jgi:adenylate kinase
LTHILIMGAPGSGKGTQAATVSAACAVPAISTGDIFRTNIRDNTALGEPARAYVTAGEYVPDSVTNAMVRERLRHDDCRDGFVLDGYPRTLAQVGALDRMLADTRRRLDTVIVIEVDGDELAERLLRRAEIEHREDDTEDVVRRRLKLYSDETAPLLDEYQRRHIVQRVDGTGTIEDVTARILAALDAEPRPLSPSASAGRPGSSGRSVLGTPSTPS